MLYAYDVNRPSKTVGTMKKTCIKHYKDIETACIRKQSKNLM